MLALLVLAGFLVPLPTVGAHLSGGREPGLRSGAMEPPPALLPAPPPGSNLSWTNLTSFSGPGPSAREGAAVAYDPALGGVLLFGGLSGTGASNETWLYRDGGWTNLTPSLSVAPSPRYKSAMAYDPVDQAGVLFCGYSGSSYYGDTWLFEGGRWTEIFPSPSPLATEDTAMAFDSTDGYAVLFGGETTGGAFTNETWTFANATWTNRTSGAAPPAREAAAMAYDPALSGVLLFGGDRVGGGVYADTWTYSSGAWTNLTATAGTAPPGRELASMEYDPVDRVLLLFDGYHYPSALDSERLFLSGQWVGFTPTVAPSARFDPSLVWTPNAGTGLFLLFGGASGSTAASRLNDTWGLRPSLTATLTATRTVLDAGQVSNLTANVSGGYPPAVLGWAGLPAGCTPVGEYANCTFASAGDYSVRVSATDRYENGAESSALSIAVAAFPSLVASVSPLSGPAPLNVTYSASLSGGSPPLNFAWEFGDGGSSTAAAGTHVYGAAGTYVVNLTVTDNASVAQNASFSVTVAPGPVSPPLAAQASAAPTAGSAPLNATFTGSATGGVGPYRFSWAFGDGSNGTGTAVTHRYAAAGTFEAVLEVTDSSGSRAAAYVNVTVGPALIVHPTAFVATACYREAAVANATYSVVISGGTAPYTVTWDLGGGGAPVPGLEANVSFRANATGFANVTVVDAQGHRVTAPVEAVPQLTPTGCSTVHSTGGPALWEGSLTWILLPVVVAAVALAALVLHRRRRRGG